MALSLQLTQRHDGNQRAAIKVDRWEANTVCWLSRHAKQLGIHDITDTKELEYTIIVGSSS